MATATGSTMMVCIISSKTRSLVRNAPATKFERRSGVRYPCEPGSTTVKILTRDELVVAQVLAALINSWAQHYQCHFNWSQDCCAELFMAHASAKSDQKFDQSSSDFHYDLKPGRLGRCNYATSL